MNKPPLGIMPRHIHEYHRMVELSRAIHDYINEYSVVNDIDVLKEWIEELSELASRVKKVLPTTCNPCGALATQDTQSLI